MEQPPTAPSSPLPKYPDQLEGEVAGCQVRLQLDTRMAPWHEELSGTLFLDGGEHAGTFSVQVVIETYPDQVAQGQELLPYREWRAVTVSSRERVRVCFALRMPGSVPLRCLRLRAVVRAGWRHSTTLCAGIHVTPPLPFQRLAARLEELTGVPVQSWNRVEAGDAVTARFVPAAHRPKPFEALQVELFRNNGVVYGTVTLDPLERTFADRLKSAVGADRVSVPFRFPEGDFRGVAGFYQQTLLPLITGQKHLPIPAAQPAPSPSELPLPATAAPGEPLDP